jgi:hypothetical protein
MQSDATVAPTLSPHLSHDLNPSLKPVRNLARMFRVAAMIAELTHASWCQLSRPLSSLYAT